MKGISQFSDCEQIDEEEHDKRYLNPAVQCDGNS